MKKLLLLGGSLCLRPVVQKAHELGCYIIVCDINTDSPIIRFADKYYNVSVIDTEGIINIARKEKIDGIMSFACDLGVVTASYVAEALGLPSPGPFESIKILQNKKSFRTFLKNNDFNVPYFEAFKKGDTVNLSKIRFPVIVKPVDSAGSKGVTRANCKEELSRAITTAIANSSTESYIIEEFLEKQKHSSDTDCFSVDGNLAFCSFSAQFFDKNADNPYVPSAYGWPSDFSQNEKNILRSELQRVITLLNLTTSIYNVETCISNGRPYIMEVTPRGGGNRLAEVIHISNNDIDLIENAIRYSIGIPMKEVLQLDYERYNAIIVLHSNTDGVFDHIYIDCELEDKIIDKDIWVNKGQVVNAFKGGNCCIGTVILKFDSKEEMSSVLTDIDKYIRVVVHA